MHEQTPNPQEILQNIDQLLSQEGHSSSVKNSTDKLREHILPALSSSRDIQSTIYSWEPARTRGVVTRGKNLILSKVKNIVINVIEKFTARQQKYNELVYQAIVELSVENQNLRDQLASSHDKK